MTPHLSNNYHLPASPEAAYIDVEGRVRKAKRFEYCALLLSVLARWDALRSLEGGFCFGGSLASRKSPTSKRLIYELASVTKVNLRSDFPTLRIS